MASRLSLGVEFRTCAARYHVGRGAQVAVAIKVGDGPWNHAEWMDLGVEGDAEDLRIAVDQMAVDLDIRRAEDVLCDESEEFRL